jgi:hypothetical protein
MVWKPDYVTASDLAAFLRIGDSDDDTQLALAVSTASRAVDNHTHRQFGQVAAAEARIYEAKWSRRLNRWVVTIDDLMDVTGLDVQAENGGIDSYTLHPINARQKGKPYEQLVVHADSTVKPSGERLVTMTAPWGWTAYPTAVKEATLLQGSRFHFRRFSPAGVAGSPDTGSEVRLLARLDPDVAVSLKDYIRWWGAA